MYTGDSPLEVTLLDSGVWVCVQVSSLSTCLTYENLLPEPFPPLAFSLVLGPVQVQLSYPIIQNPNALQALSFCKFSINSFGGKTWPDLN